MRGDDESNVDWVRYAAGVHSRAADTIGLQWSGLGDPTRWGADGAVNVPLALGVFATPQLNRVQSIDPYSRNWQLIGTVSATKQFWGVSAANLTLGLEVTPGSGQSTVTPQVFDLRALTDLAAPWYVVPPAVADTDVLAKPFVIAGGIVGRALAVRLVVQALTAVILEDPQVVRITSIISPYSAGPM